MSLGSLSGGVMGRGALGSLALRRGGGGAATIDYYVDSVAGDNDNDGASIEEAWATLAKAQATLSAGQGIGLVAGSEWREKYTNPSAGGLVAFAGDVVDGIPVIDGADEITGTWTQPDSGTYPDVWQISVTRGAISGAGVDYFAIWIDGEYPRFASSISDLQTNGGWRPTSSPINQTTVTVQIKSATDPNSNGVLYEYTERATCIAAGHNNGGLGGQIADVTGPLELKRAYAHYGMLALGKGATGKKLLLRSGGIHHAVVECNLLEDVILTDQHNLGAAYPTAAPSMLVFYSGAALADNYRPVGRRILSFGRDDENFLDSAIYSHAGDGGVPKLTLEQCGAFRVGQPFSPDGLGAEFQADGCYAERCARPFSPVALVNSVRYTVVNDPRPFANQHVFGDLGPASTAVKSWSFEHCVVYMNASNLNIWRNITRNGSLTIRNCLVVFGDGVVPSAGCVIASANNLALSVVFEHNVIVRPVAAAATRNTLNVTLNGGSLICDKNIYIGNSKDSQATVDMRLNGTNYSYLSDWQAQGYDTNSIDFWQADTWAESLDFFQGDPADGDFRLAAGLGTFGDGSSANLAGPQFHWDWNARAVAAGAPSAFPALPKTLAYQRTYIKAPDQWDFYP